MTEARKDKIIDKTSEKKQLSFEAKQNLLGFFSLLLKIDMRNNPQNYKRPKNDEDYRSSNNTD